MVTVLYPLAFMFVGAVLLAAPLGPTAKECGKGLFWAGAFALAFYLSAHPLHLG